eukprot:11169543-Lingulodinium_polyedra.AAC.1
MVEGSARFGPDGQHTHYHGSSAAVNLQVGEEVGFYRHPSSKDAAGYVGPAEVIDVTRATRGIISVKWRAK